MDLCLTDSSAGKWPCRLHSMTLGGTLDSAVVKTFEWPPAIDQLIFLGYASLDLSALRIALSHPVLFSQIRRLTFLINKPGMLADDSGLNILYELPNLVYLRIPIDIFLNMAHEDLPHWNSVPLKVLELEQHVELEEDESDVTDILGQLRTIFSNVWALGLTQNTMRIFRQRVKELEDEIWSHIPDDEEMLAEGLRALEGGDIGLYII
ncbi:hypothetical protein N7462_002507 [Penicillium macrosclerotiorum]|uniref:uncharacterized protein n=1 Tax=Penicillium macrosclerotiorum TaxID=303699 RepID=UPI002547C0EC|nr:uncharacterized protein N7462_002507 [Penicillium macrosclerotiorum]KAJ5693084.1 hypothetical protein N7462_002507 [Penicillium macrosclerotiorum]